MFVRKLFVPLEDAGAQEAFARALERNECVELEEGRLFVTEIVPDVGAGAWVYLERLDPTTTSGDEPLVLSSPS